MKASRPDDINAYLAGLSADKRSALQKLRRAIRAAAPAAQECISYGMPALRLDGKILVYFRAATNHCSFFPGARPVAEHAAALARYSTSKGTVRFPPDSPLSATLVRALVKTRMAEMAAKKREVAARAQRRKAQQRAARA